MPRRCEWKKSQRKIQCLKWNQTSAARLSFLDASLFSPGDLAQLVGQFFVNFSSVADREDPDAPGLAIDFINKAKASHLVFP